MQQRRRNDMKVIESHWERLRVSLSPANLRIGLFAVSVVALVLGGAAGSQWCC
jgi:hypothetical protein